MNTSHVGVRLNSKPNWHLRNPTERILALVDLSFRHIWIKLFCLVAVAVVLAYFDFKAGQIQTFGFTGNTYLSAEMSTESSHTHGDYKRAIEKFRILLTDTIDLYSSQKFVWLTKFTNRDLNPIPALEDALRQLQHEASSKDEARKQINGAARALNAYVMKANNALSESDNVFVPKGKSAEKLAAEARQSIGVFHGAVQNLRTNMNFSTATAACLASREAGTIFQLTWSILRSAPDYDALTTQFSDDLQTASKISLEVGQNTPDDEKRQALIDYSHSLERRHLALEGIMQKNFAIVRSKLIEDSEKCRKNSF